MYGIVWVDAWDGARLANALAGRGVEGASFTTLIVEAVAIFIHPVLAPAQHRIFWAGAATGSELCVGVKYLVGGTPREVWPGGGAKAHVTFVAGTATLHPLTETLCSLRTCGKVPYTVTLASTARRFGSGGRFRTGRGYGKCNPRDGSQCTTKEGRTQQPHRLETRYRPTSQPLGQVVEGGYYAAWVGARVVLYVLALLSWHLFPLRVP
jgi:hypothetical protein